MVSLIHYHFNEVSFKKHPSQEFFAFQDYNSEMSSSYSIVPNESSQYIGIVRVLQHFGWTWIGVLTTDNMNGECFLQIMETLLSQHGICSASIQRIPYLTTWDKLYDMIGKATIIYNGINDEKINIFIVCGDSLTIAWLHQFLKDMKFNNSLGDILTFYDQKNMEDLYANYNKKEYIVTTISYLSYRELLGISLAIVATLHLCNAR
ncbi:hypothetical protein E2320_003547, partial [Naja naja]